MGETKTLDMAHFEDGDGDNPLCSNRSPVTFTKGAKWWRPSSWDSARWEHNSGRDPARYGTVMICQVCGADVIKIDP